MKNYTLTPILPDGLLLPVALPPALAKELKDSEPVIRMSNLTLEYWKLRPGNITLVYCHQSGRAAYTVEDRHEWTDGKNLQDVIDTIPEGTRTW